MSTEITFRHMDAVPHQRGYAEEKAAELAADFPRVEHVHVILEVHKNRSIAEVVVQAKNRIRCEAKDEADKMRVAIDDAFDKVSRQLRRKRDKVQDHKSTMRNMEQDRGQGVEA